MLAVHFRTAHTMMIDQPEHGQARDTNPRHSDQHLAPVGEHEFPPGHLRGEADDGEEARQG